MALACELKSKPRHALNPFTRHHERIGCDLSAQKNACSAARIQAFGILSDNNVVNITRRTIF